MNATAIFLSSVAPFIGLPFVASRLNKFAAHGTTSALIMSSSLPLPPPPVYAGAVTVELDCRLLVSAGYRTRIAADRLKEAVAKGAKLHIGGVFEGRSTNRPSSAMCRSTQLLPMRKPSDQWW